MINIYRSPKGWLSLIGVYVGLLLIVLTIFLALTSQSMKFWPILIVGLVIGFVSTPFYYYFKTRDRQARNPYETQVNTLGEVGRQAEFRRKTANIEEVKPKPVYPSWGSNPDGKKDPTSKI